MSARIITNDAQTNREPLEWLAQRFKQVDWLVPAYLSLGYLHQFAAAIDKAPKDQKLEVMRQWLTATYTPEYLAVMFQERYRKIPYVREFDNHISECIEAYFSGLKIVAVAAFVPIIEGIVRKMATSQSRHLGDGTAGVKAEFENILQRELDSPNCYGERLVMLEVLRDFIRDRFLVNTNNYNGMNELNRHGIVHGVFGQYGDELNFFRLVTLLDLLCFSVSLIEGGFSLLGQETTFESRELATRWKRLQLRG